MALRNFESRKIAFFCSTALLLLQCSSYQLSPGALAQAEEAAAQSQFASQANLVPEQSPSSLSLKGLVSVYEGPSPDELVGGLVQSALKRAEEKEQLDEKAKKMSGLVQKAISSAKITAHFVIEYRGFELSSEGADIVLGEKLKLKSQSAAELASQKRADDMHAKVFASLLQIGQGLGYPQGRERQRVIEAGQNQLKELVGEEAADAALKNLEAWSQQLKVPESVFAARPWSMMELQEKTDTLIKEAMTQDPVVGLIKRALHKYNGHSKLALGAAKVINTSLNIAMFSPTLAAPIANILQYFYQMSTGGPEDMKLLTELYLDKRLESRWKRLNLESNQAVNAYNNAIMSKNPVLLGLSETFIGALGDEASNKIIGGSKQIARKTTHDDSIDCLQTHNTM